MAFILYWECCSVDQMSSLGCLWGRLELGVFGGWIDGFTQSPIIDNFYSPEYETSSK